MFLLPGKKLEGYGLEEFSVPTRMMLTWLQTLRLSYDNITGLKMFMNLMDEIAMTRLLCRQNW